MSARRASRQALAVTSGPKNEPKAFWHMRQWQIEARPSGFDAKAHRAALAAAGDMAQPWRASGGQLSVSWSGCWWLLTLIA